MSSPSPRKETLHFNYKLGFVFVYIKWTNATRITQSKPSPEISGTDEISDPLKLNPNRVPIDFEAAESEDIIFVNTNIFRIPLSLY